MSKKKVILLSLVLILLTFTSGCGGQDQSKGQEKEAEVMYIEAKSKVNQEKADSAKRELVKMKEVKEVRGAAVDDDIYLALTVEGFDRLFLDRIRKDAHQKIKNKYPDDNIHITTDRKLSSDLEKLEKKLSKDGVKKGDLKQNLKKIEDDMKG
ncbi:YhcN/YlaJ family sporulation lipoprotein [Bacillus sp. H-16]|uniref:YhcN/YlaJ family sporulation lipoprotein n=1 Tax=Alteribacter salitolerans TaxID=2912333 RepID=UPI00196584B5|nr:YhcN/YlaJ family sporulation lipoprotein [Alteribacter salitolerans]